ncbi:protein DROOPING LEAF-like [Curcuma longa]|uniref:protein DROOPING LEAF-like n=1 Tax=Curcuma longa TaxID=136217 RepID=UPI003D9DD088
MEVPQSKIPGINKEYFFRRINASFWWLQVGVPCKRLLDTVTVKCGHYNHLSFLSPRPIQQPLSLTDHPTSQIQGQVKLPSRRVKMSSKLKNLMRSTVDALEGHGIKIALTVDKRDEIQRIKAAQPDIPHREAFS